MGFSKITEEAVVDLHSRIGKPITRVTQPLYREINRCRTSWPCSARNS